tara:strand:- start:578 stop:811 length:234 start_codon:yes stop_codon:yes gene_type:complete
MNARRAAWTEARGPIPKGWVIHNLNGNLDDNRLENLAAIPRKTGNISEVVAPYRERIRILELELRKEKLKDGHSTRG